MPQSSSNPEPIGRLREASREARRLADEHRRAQPRDGAGPDEVGDGLRRRAEKAAAELEAAEAGRRADALAKRRADASANSGDLQSRLRAEARARREQQEKEGS